MKYDDVGIARLAADYLFEKGHRRIAFLQWQSEFQTVKDRYKGYVESHGSHGAAVNSEYCVTAPQSLQNWDKEIVGRLFRLPQPPTAIVAENEIIATLCVNALFRLGMRVPHDVAVVGLGDVLSDAYYPVPMTVVAFRHEQAMCRALDLLMELIERPELRKQPPQVFVQEPELIVRESA